MKNKTWENKIQFALDNNIPLDEDDLYRLVCEYEIQYFEGDNHRWQQEVTSIIEFNNKTYAISWMRALTEMQDSNFYNQPIEVHKQERPITVTLTEWIDNKKEIIASSYDNF